MDKILIRGGRKLQGTVQASGAKNAALPVLISSLLTDEPCRFSKVPVLQDVRTTLKLLGSLGAQVDREKFVSSGQVTVRTQEVSSSEAPYDLVRTMRASVVVLGPLLARTGQAKVSLPGGCAIGARPIDQHLMGLEKLGAKISMEGGYVIAQSRKLRGARVTFDFPSVGATENVMMAAVLAQGESVLENCAREPEIVDLARVLVAMGARIEDAGKEKIRIQGVDRLHGCDFSIMGDRIEAGTYLAAGFATRGSVRVEGIDPEFLEAVLVKFEEAGASITREKHAVAIQAQNRPKAVSVQTQPFPGFPTDMQAQFLSLMCIADGASVITENIFENRFMHVPELARMGADVTVRGKSAFVQGVDALHGAPVMATDLRASASLVLGGLCASGETTVSRIYHLDRGYERIESKLSALGADIERVTEGDT